MKYFTLIFCFILINCSNRDVKVFDLPVTKIKVKPLTIKKSDVSEMPDRIKKVLRFKKNKHDYSYNVYEPGKEYGGFTPRYPMLLLINNSLSFKSLKEGEGMFPICYELLIKKENKYLKISDKTELMNIFSPVDSPEEAISLVCVLTHSEPLYDFDLRKKNKYFKKQLFKTYVTQVGNDFVVHLFHLDHFGCPPHEMTQISYLVKRNGEILEIAKEKVYDDTENTRCVD